MAPVTNYAQQLEALKDIFGTRDVRLAQESLVVERKTYPIVDEVIVLLDPEQYPESLRRRLGLNAIAGTPRDSAFAEDVQISFGKEWTTFPRILPEHESEFFQYFDLIPLESLKDTRICDLGCGNGRWSYFLRQRCKELILVDFSEGIFVARQNLRDAPNALFFMADLTRLPFRENFADFIFSIGVLHHLPTSALDEIRRLGNYAPRLLIYLYYALDNRPRYFRLFLNGVGRLRKALARHHSLRFRSAVTWCLLLGIYAPMLMLGTLAKPLGLSSYVPLYEGYRGSSLEGVRQDVYDRFFTSIEHRYTRAEIMALADSFSKVVVSDKLPYWHFVCER